jgi:hypothetical protein
VRGTDKAANVDPVTDGPGGAVIRVHVVPSARDPGIDGPDPWRGALVVRVQAPARKGAANAELRERVARALEVEPGRVTLLGGARSRDKTLRVHGLAGEEVRRRLGDAL